MRTKRQYRHVSTRMQQSCNDSETWVHRLPARSGITGVPRMLLTRRASVTADFDRAPQSQTTTTTATCQRWASLRNASIRWSSRRSVTAASRGQPAFVGLRNSIGGKAGRVRVCRSRSRQRIRVARRVPRARVEEEASAHAFTWQLTHAHRVDHDTYARACEPLATKAWSTW